MNTETIRVPYFGTLASDEEFLTLLAIAGADHD